MKVVLDTNIWLSGLFWSGEASKIVELAEKRKIEIVLSKDIILEIINVLNKEAKFQKFLEEREQKVQDIIKAVLFIGNLINTKTKIEVIKEHSADNIILETALDGKADYIVSYDKHILSLKEFGKIKIITPKEFLRLVKH